MDNFISANNAEFGIRGTLKAPFFVRSLRAIFDSIIIICHSWICMTIFMQIYHTDNFSQTNNCNTGEAFPGDRERS